ncbi:MAG: hypothetical protein JSU61_08300 [Fidelibacterota bacterium]|nr:MAG: hypothetical protein JSU61_08300 [Candidatus Neomarinimicrobiota bacterium]
MPRIELQSGLPWSLVLAAVVVLSVLIVAYGIWIRALPRSYRTLILIFRTSLVAVVFLLFLDPKVEWVRNVSVAPRIGLFLDNSLSMANHAAASATTIFSQARAVADWAREKEYEPVIMTFGENLIPRANLQFTYEPDERITDFGPLIESWRTSELQAGFLFSDGIATSGVSPGIIDGPSEVPIFTIGIGDTTVGLDLSITEVRYPLSLLEQEQGTIKIGVQGSNAAHRRSRLYVFHEDQLIHSEPIIITSRDFVQSVEAPVVGRLDAPRFRVELMVLPEEANIDNNRREFQIDVLPGKRQVAILTGSLSPNTSLISAAVRPTPRASVDELVYLRGMWRGEEAKFWSTTYDLIILDNYPTGDLPEGHLERLITKVQRDKTSILLVEGPDCQNRGFNRLMRSLGQAVQMLDDAPGTMRSLLPMLQADLEGLPVTAVSGIGVDFPPSVAIHALDAPAENLKAVLQDEQENLVVSYGIIGGKKRSFILMPALAATHQRLTRTGRADYFPDLLEALVEWSLEPAGFSPYVIQADRREYQLGEKVLLRGIIRDRAGIQILQPTLTVEVQGPESAAIVTMTYDFDLGEYDGEYWPSDPGSYRLKVYTGSELGEASFHSAFQVQTGRIELESLAQNRYGLERLAYTTGGRYADLQGFNSLLEELSYSARSTQRIYQFSLWQIRFLWVGLILILGIEWIVRRLVGLV